MKKLTSFALLGATLLTTACGGSSDSSETTAATTSAETTASAETELFEKDSLPELDFGGESVTFSVMSNRVKQYTIEDQTGDVVDDSIYTANLNVENRLNVNLEYAVFSYGGWDDRTTYMAKVEQSILADSGDFDVIVTTSFMPEFMVKGYLSDMSDLPYLEFSKPWWSSDMAEQVEFNGIIPFMTGDISIGKTKAMHCMFFNKNIAEDLGLEDIYELVFDGKWTFEKFAEMCTTAYSDINGNNTVDEGDRLAFTTDGGNYYAGLLDALGMTVINKNNDKFEFVFDNEYNTRVMQTIVPFFNNTPGIFQINGDGATHLAEENCFKDGNTLFTGGWIGCAESYRNVKFDYGITPYPKFDDAQEDYGVTILQTYSNYALPVTNDRHEITCAAIEALASEYYRTVTPAYFETTLKVKYSNDDEMSRMFDLLRDRSSFDFAMTFDNVLDYITTNLKVSIQNSDSNWTSRMASQKSVTLEKLDVLLAAYDKMAS